MKYCLIVDDSKVIRMVARKILEELEFETGEPNRTAVARVKPCAITSRSTEPRVARCRNEVTMFGMSTATSAPIMVMTISISISVKPSPRRRMVLFNIGQALSRVMKDGGETESR